MQINLWDQFVFPKISYSPKGEMIKTILDEIHLQAKHTLFIDDNESNLREAKYYNPEINILNANDCDTIPVSDWGIYDENLTRLKQYKTLEEKSSFRKKSSSNEEFLRQSSIKLEFINYSEEKFERLYELVERTNQLNFTKNRMNKDELKICVNNPEIKTQLIRAEDNFGDYGIIGFYSLYKSNLIHFVFSCRIMNMGIEQFVYEYLNYPNLTVVGETATKVGRNENKIDYIKVIENLKTVYQDESIEHVLSQETKLNIFASGACDLFHVLGYFSMPNQNLCYECNVFLGNKQGVNVGTEYIRSSLEMNDVEKAFCRAHFYNYARYNVFDSKIFDPNWDYVILSFSEDMRSKIYEYKSNPNLRAIEPFDFTRKETVSYYITNIDGVIQPSVEQEIKWISDNFNVKFISPQRFADNLTLIANKIPAHTKIILITGPEIGGQFNYPQEVIDQILKLNFVIKVFAQHFPKKFAMVEINDVIKSKDDVTDGPFHLQAITAYNLFLKIIDTIVRKFPSLKDPMLQKVLNGRKLCIFGKGDFEMINAYYNLKMGNCNPTDFVYHLPVANSSFNINDWKKYINKKDEYFIVVACNSNYSVIRNLLIDSHYEPLKDFVQWKPIPYRISWTENPSTR